MLDHTSIEVLIATAGTFASKFSLECGKGYITRPPELFDGKHYGLPLAYKKALVLKDWKWDRDYTPNPPEWIDKAFNPRPGNKRGEFSYIYYDVKAEAWCVQLTFEQIKFLMQRMPDFRLAWSSEMELFALCEKDSGPEDVVTSTGWGMWAAEWIKEGVSQDE